HLTVNPRESCLTLILSTSLPLIIYHFFFSSRRRHTRSKRDWSSDVCSSDLPVAALSLKADRTNCARPIHPRGSTWHRRYPPAKCQGTPCLWAYLTGCPSIQTPAISARPPIAESLAHASSSSAALAIPTSSGCPGVGRTRTAAKRFPCDRSPTLSSRSRAWAPALVAKCSRWAEVSGCPPFGSSCCMKYACTPSLNMLKPFPAPTSVPSATLTPVSMCRRNGKNPLARAEFDVGQCAAAAPVSAIRASSRSFG